MDARQVGIEKDPAPTALFGADDGELCGLEPVGSARVDPGGEGSTGLIGGDFRPQIPFGPAGVDLGGLGSTGLVVGDLRSRDPSRPTGVDLLGHASEHVSGVDLLGRDDVRSSHRVAHPPGTEHGGTNPEPAFASTGDDLRGRNPLGEPVHPIGAEGAVVQDPSADFRPAGARRGRGGPMHPPALLAILLGAMIIIGEPDAPWHRQFGAFLIFLIGCFSLFQPRL